MEVRSENLFDMKLLAHACIRCRINGFSMITDPWFLGTAFNDGWCLSPQPGLDEIEEEIQGTDLIWISHEHPDHLNFPTLKWIASTFASTLPRIAVQYTNDDKVLTALAKLGFSDFLVMDHMERYNVHGNISIGVYSTGTLDSALGLFVENKHVWLNVNDAELTGTDARIIKKEWGSPHLITNQFSIAGTDGIKQNLKSDAEKVSQSLLRHHILLDADVTIPVASFMEFCQDDNRYINEYANPPWAALSLFEKAGKKLRFLSVLGESLRVNVADDFRSNIDVISHREKKRLSESYKVNNSADQAGPERSGCADIAAVINVIESRLVSLRGNTNPLVWVWFGSVTFCITDSQNQIIEVDFRRCRVRMLYDTSDADIFIRAQPLTYTFSQKFGVQTLGVSGRYRVVTQSGRQPRSWIMFRMICALDNAAIHLSIASLARKSTVRWLWSRRKGLVSQTIDRVKWAFRLP